MEYLEESLAGQGGLVLTRREVARLVSIYKKSDYCLKLQTTAKYIQWVPRKKLVKHAIFIADLQD